MKTNCQEQLAEAPREKGLSRSGQLTPRQGAAVRHLYVELGLSCCDVARRLGLSFKRVQTFLLQSDAWRGRGGVRGDWRQHLERELATVPDAVLARKYRLSREMVRRFRRECGRPSSAVLRQQLRARDAELARAHFVSKYRLHQLRKELGYPPDSILRRELRRRLQQQRADPSRMPRYWSQQGITDFEQLGRRWRAGATLKQLAAEHGTSVGCMTARICAGRRRNPEQFPLRRLLSPTGRARMEKQRQRFWRAQLPKINRLSQQWQTGRTIRDLAQQQNLSFERMKKYLQALRKRFPTKFPPRLLLSMATPPPPIAFPVSAPPR